MDPQLRHLVAALQRGDPALTDADLGFRSLGPAFAREVGPALKHNRELRSLDLAHNRIGPEGAKHVATHVQSNPNLQNLNLFNAQFGDAGCMAIAAALGRCHSVVRLNLAACPFEPVGLVTSKGALRLAQLLGEDRCQLNWLSLAHNAGIDDEACRALVQVLRTKNSRVAHLDLTGTGAAATTLAALDQLLADRDTVAVTAAELERAALLDDPFGLCIPAPPAAPAARAPPAAIAPRPVSGRAFVMPEPPSAGAARPLKAEPATAPDWTPDHIVVACEICDVRFSLTRRKHHCRKCGRCICAACSPKTRWRPLPELGLPTPQRICKKCR